ncbi:MAG TPA: MFS transporter [Steroidobacteraceae bacterium]|jgi:AAHS family 4-hydroxybenzoate transporter-like MFS transporter|nr:MFS transporter [Steroidobacteraceae bacterium]
MTTAASLRVPAPTSTPLAGIEIDDLMDAHPLSALQKYVLVLCALAVMCDGYSLQDLALTVPSLTKAWGITPASLSVALSASLLGMGIGAAVLAPLGDRYGRRAVLAGTMAIVGAASLATALADNVLQMELCRFFTGAALGASLANAYSLTADFMPRRRRASLITLAYCNTATGALVAGLLVPSLIARYGWPATFVVGGAFPLALSVALVMTGPESIKFLLHRRPRNPAIATILRNIAPGVVAETVYLRPVGQALTGSVRDLFKPRYRASTLLLWLAYAMNSFVLYLLVSWLPTLLTGAGWLPAQAIRAMAFNQVGGIVGGLSLAWLMDRFGAERTLAAGFAVNAVALLLFLVVPSGFLSWGALLLLIGACTGGSIFAIVSLAVTLYPSSILATGSGWASAIARVGAVASPLVGGALIAAGVAPTFVIAGLAVPAAIFVISMLGLQRARPPA